MNAAEFSIRQRVLINMLVITLLVAGVFSFFNLRREIFPSISANYISVTTLDVTLNAPEDVERLITVPIEDQLRDIEEIYRLTSVSSPNLARIFMELREEETDVQAVLNEVRQKVDQAKRDLPRSAENPVIEEVDFPFPVLVVGMTYSPRADRIAMKRVADDIENELMTIPSVASVVVAGLSDRELWIEVDPYRAQAYGLSLAQIGAAIRARNLDVPGGVLKTTTAGEYTLRTLAQVRENTWRTLADVVIQRSGGQTVRVRDVAVIHNTFEEDSTLGRVDGKPAITFTVNKQESGDTIKIADHIRTVVERARLRLPSGVDLLYFSDSSKYVRTRLQTMVTNGIQSLVIVAVMLLLFMNWRVALLVLMGLVTAFLGAFTYLYMTGQSLNMISLFALILVLGMLVDDAIVVCENVYRYMEMGLPLHQATIRGASEVSWPIVGTVTTTIVAFVPLMLTQGIIGKFIRVVPQVVAVALAVSLLEALFVLPSHIADFVHPEEHKIRLLTAGAQHSWWERFSIGVENMLSRARMVTDRGFSRLTELYLYVLGRLLRWRWLVMLAALLVFISAVALPATGLLRFNLFGADYVDRFFIEFETPLHYRLEDTSAAVLAVEREILAELPTNDLAAVITSIGSRLERGNEFMMKLGNNQAMVTVDIDEENKRCRPPDAILADLRAIVHRHNAFMTARVSKEEGGPPVGKAVTVNILGDDFTVLRRIADEYKAYLATLPGIVDIIDDFEQGKKELHIDVDESRAALAGCDAETVGMAVMNAFQGAEVSVFRWGNDEVTVRVKYADDFRRNLEDVRAFRIMNQRGARVPLSALATVTHAPGFASINRQNRKRVITVTADVDDKRITSREANVKVQQAFRTLESRYPGYSATYTGEEEDTNKSMKSMAIAGIIALVLIFAILAGILNSFFQPILIMGIIPMGLVGVTYGFMMFQLPLGFMALMGTIGLAGIIVNDGIVLMSFINDYRRDWQGRHGIGREVPASTHQHCTRYMRWSSLLRSGATRLRPIFLAEATTVAGMSTIAFVRTGQEQFIAPMALAIVCGLTFGVIVTLVMLPCLYAMLDDVVHYFSGPGDVPGAHGE
ncbi:MAG: efflux RND transporter permease subunit [bacterium]|nr:efflux RND transporter permease subunit [bacterium]